MRKTDRRLPWLIGTAGLALATLLVKPGPVSGFTQSGVATFFGSLIPMGHEWIKPSASQHLSHDEGRG